MIDRASQSIYVESNPYLGGFVEALGDVFDRPRLVHVVRDPRSFIRSSINFGTFRGMKGLVNRWVPYWLPKPERLLPPARPCWNEMSQPMRLAWYWDLVNCAGPWREDLWAGLPAHTLRRPFARDGSGVRTLIDWVGLPANDGVVDNITRQPVNASRDHGFPRFRDWEPALSRQILNHCRELMQLYGYDEKAEAKVAGGVPSDHGHAAQSVPTGGLQPPPSRAAPRGSRRWLRLAIGLPLLAVVWYFVGKTLLVSFRNIDWRHLHINWFYMASAGAMLVLSRFFNALSCHQALATLGEKTAQATGSRDHLGGGAGRYIPGKVAAVAGSLIMLGRIGVRLPVAAAALFLSTAMMILVSLLACAPLLFTRFGRHEIPEGWLVSIILLAAGLVCLHPHVFTRLCNLLLRKTSREPLPKQLAPGPYLLTIAITIFRVLLLGCALWFAARALAPISIARFPRSMMAGGLATVAGFMAVFAPAGLGVHEGVYLLAMTPVFRGHDLHLTALMVACFRFFNLFCDASTGATGLLLLRGYRASPAQTKPAEEHAPV